MASVRKLDSGRWQGQYRDATGRRHTRVWPTRTAAREWAHDGESAVRRGAHRDPRAGLLTLEDWHARWTAARVVEDVTRRRDTIYARDVLARFGAYPLTAITRMEVQAWVRELEVAGRGPTAVAMAHQQLASVLEAAVDDDLLVANPARRVRLPVEPTQPDRILDHDEEARLLAALPLEQDRTMTILMLDAGLRWGEVAGLHAHRVDMLRRELHVVEVLTQRGQVKSYPKSRRSRRTLPLEGRALEALAVHQEQRSEGLLFRATKRGAGRSGDVPPIGAMAWRRRAWHPAVVTAGLALPTPTPHDCRHTALSRLVAAGVDMRTVQEFAGHESITTTMRYVHALPDADQKVRTALRAIRDQRAGGADLAHGRHLGTAT